MRLRFAWLILSAWLLAGCTGRAEAVRAAQPYIEHFGELRYRTLKLLELRADIERKRLLLLASKVGEESLPPSLKPLYEQMVSERDEVTEEQVKHGEEAFWRLLDFTFSQDPNVLQAEIVYLEEDGSRPTFRYPRERELPAGVRWHGLREHRTFAGLSKCRTDDGGAPCVLLQLRPTEYSGSAGLTVAYHRAPLNVAEVPPSNR